MTSVGDFELTMNELRAVTEYTVACAVPVLGLFEQAAPDDDRPASALKAAQEFVDGEARSKRLRTSATEAHRAGREAPTQAASHAATAGGDAAASAFLHPLANATQVRHILGAATHAARAAELSRGDDPVVAEYMLHAAARRMTPTVRGVLGRYPRAPRGNTRHAALMQQLDSLIRDPAPQPQPADDAGPFFHGTRGRPPSGRPPHPRLAPTTDRARSRSTSTSRRRNRVPRWPPRLRSATARLGSTASNRWAPSTTTRTSRTRSSPATRRAPTGRGIRCGWWRRSSVFRYRIPPSSSVSVRTRPFSRCSASRRWTTDG